MNPSRECSPPVSWTISVPRAALVLVMGALLCHPERARGTTSYSITLQGASQSSNTPLHGTLWTATPGVAPTIINEAAAAVPGVVGARARLETAWPFQIAFAFGGSAAAQAAADDFVITGPANATSVQGTLWFRTKIRLDRGDGFAGSDLHRARALLHVTAGELQADGSCWSTNLDAGSDGVLSGHSPPLLELSFPVTGTFPVAEPFVVSMDFEAANQTFGDSTVSPGFTETDGLETGIALGDEHGHVMDLPTGYTLNAPSWHVVANAMPVAGVPRIDTTEPGLAAPMPNPSTGSAILGLSLPHAGEVSLVVTDLQGRLIRHLVAGRMEAGSHHEVWDGRRDSGERVAPGMYFAVVRYENRTLARRLVRF